VHVQLHVSAAWQDIVEQVHPPAPHNGPGDITPISTRKRKPASEPLGSQQNGHADHAEGKQGRPTSSDETEAEAAGSTSKRPGGHAVRWAPIQPASFIAALHEASEHLDPAARLQVAAVLACWAIISAAPPMHHISFLRLCYTLLGSTACSHSNNSPCSTEHLSLLALLINVGQTLGEGASTLRQRLKAAAEQMVAGRTHLGWLHTTLSSALHQLDSQGMGSGLDAPLWRPVHEHEQLGNPGRGAGTPLSSKAGGALVKSLRADLVSPSTGAAAAAGEPDGSQGSQPPPPPPLRFDGVQIEVNFDAFRSPCAAMSSTTSPAGKQVPIELLEAALDAAAAQVSQAGQEGSNGEGSHPVPSNPVAAGLRALEAALRVLSQQVPASSSSQAHQVNGTSRGCMVGGAHLPSTQSWVPIADAARQAAIAVETGQNPSPGLHSLFCRLGVWAALITDASHLWLQRRQQQQQQQQDLTLRRLSSRRLDMALGMLQVCLNAMDPLPGVVGV
jgi:hypothetical protein